ncbi:MULTISPECIES: enoyl-CoA hydratase-related protein [Aeromicrobium]|uniref:enoyl-CoA hydratase-related protein n=1 Tax=Aeromicrobium TaxID=2040 RepID=UPI001CA84321|nr:MULTISPECIES: enoyl-CoA hydratase-related protein [Aeromicrobium]
MPLVELGREDTVRTITLNAPDRLNALDWPLLQELRAAVESVAADDEARALVVTGAGKAFCSGANLESLFGDTSRPADVLREHLMNVYSSFLGIRSLSIPTIAAVQGAAVGAGLNIALACDVIIAGPQAGFGPTFSRIGLHPGGGCNQEVRRRRGAVRPARVAELRVVGAGRVAQQRGVRGLRREVRLALIPRADRPRPVGK